MSECYDSEHDEMDEKEILQRKLAEEINAEDYVVWDVFKTRRNERKERIVTFSGIEAIRIFSPEYDRN